MPKPDMRPDCKEILERLEEMRFNFLEKLGKNLSINHSSDEINKSSEK